MCLCIEVQLVLFLHYPLFSLHQLKARDVLTSGGRKDALQEET